MRIISFHLKIKVESGDEKKTYKINSIEWIYKANEKRKFKCSSIIKINENKNVWIWQWRLFYNFFFFISIFRKICACHREKKYVFVYTNNFHTYDNLHKCSQFLFSIFHVCSIKNAAYENKTNVAWNLLHIIKLKRVRESSESIIMNRINI